MEKIQRLYEDCKAALGGEAAARKGRGLTLVDAGACNPGLPACVDGRCAARPALILCESSRQAVPSSSRSSGCRRCSHRHPSLCLSCSSSLLPAPVPSFATPHPFLPHSTLPHTLCAEPAPSSSRGGWFSGLFGARQESTAAAAPAVQGLYMYGGVGVGKTMLMDLMAKHAPDYFKVRSILVERIVHEQYITNIKFCAEIACVSRA